MSLRKSLFILDSIVLLLLGLALLVLNVNVAELYGVTLAPVGIFFARVLGGVLIGKAVLMYLVRNHADDRIGQGVSLAMIVGWGIPLIVALIAQMDNLFNAWGWATVLVTLLFTVAFGWAALTEPDFVAEEDWRRQQQT